MKIILSIFSIGFFLFYSFSAQAIDHGTWPNECPSQCTGAQPSEPFNFSHAVSGVDPVNGGPLGKTIKVPVDEGSSETENISTEDYKAGLQDFEQFSSAQCGESLTSDAHSAIEISQSCSNSTLDQMARDAKNKHKIPGIKPPPQEIINKFFKLASSPEAQQKLKTKVYLSNDRLEIFSDKCMKENVKLAAKDTLGLEVKTETCRLLYLPKIPTLTQIGLPQNSTTEIRNSYSLDASMFGISVSILSGKLTVAAPFSTTPKVTGAISRAGIVVESIDQLGESIEIDRPYVLDEYSYSQEIPVPIGPLVLVIGFEARGQLSSPVMVRATRMWANASLTPSARVDASVEGSLGFAIARAGAEGKLNLVTTTHTNYGFSGVAAVPINVNGVPAETFAFSEQLTGFNSISGLGGEFNAFAKVRVPKFLGLRWKKYSKNIFRWAGTSMSGNLYELQRGPFYTNQLYNDFLSSNAKKP